MIEQAWILIGMMGVGKSTVGSILAEQTERVHQDTDRLLTHRLGRPIPQLFQIFGEATFRDHETAILKSLQPGGFVISTGGGIVLREQNWAEMRRLGTTIFLDVPVDVLIDRLERSKKRRPLLQGEGMEDKVRTILEARMPLYEQADVRVNLGDLDARDGAALVLAAMGVTP
jgi:shikimate kinase